MGNFDFVIAGSDPASAIIAGLMARDHGKKVGLLTDPAAEIRLPRQAYLSFGTAVRPETLGMAARLAPETNRLLASIAGRAVLSSVSPLILSRSGQAADALAHTYHLAAHFGLEIQQADPGQWQGARRAFRVRGVHLVRQKLLWAGLRKWLDECKVIRIDRNGANVASHRDGSASIRNHDELHEVVQLVLCDDEALRVHGHGGDIRQDFRVAWATSILTEPAKIDVPVVLEPERGFMSWQHANGGIGVIMHRSAAEVGPAIEDNLATSRPPRRAGQAEFQILRSRDGAPVIGRFSRSGILVATGFGQSTVHFAPAIARFLAQAATTEEKEYFGPRVPGAGRQPTVAEFPYPGNELGGAA